MSVALTALSKGMTISEFQGSMKQAKVDRGEEWRLGKVLQQRVEQQRQLGSCCNQLGAY
jgi:hypothetical protein